MKKLYLFIISSFVLMSISLAQTLSIVSPTNGSSNVTTTIKIVYQSTSIGNTSSNPDRIYIEVSKLNNFDNSQPLPNYQVSGLWLKTDNNVKILNFQITTPLENNTTYFVRAKSSKNGYSSISSFTTTSDKLMEITAPTLNETNVTLKPTISGKSSSTNNSTVSPDKIKIQISDDVNFDHGNPLIYFEESSYVLKTDDNVKTFNWIPTTYLTSSKTYYTRLYSTKYGYSAVITFSTVSIQVASITVPSNNETNVMRSPNFTATYSGLGNSAVSPDNLYFELSKNSNFNASQSFPNYQKSGIWSKTDDNLKEFNWYTTPTLEANTDYYIRMYSSKSGYSSVVKFTTGNNIALEITQPTDNELNKDLYPIISVISRSINNSVTDGDKIFIEISDNISFTPNANTAVYQKSGIWNKTINSDINLNWTISNALKYNTVYFVRAKSSKYNYSNVISFTTKKFTDTELIEINDLSASGNNLFLNQFSSKFEASLVTEANQYRWIFDVDDDLLTPDLDTTTASNVLYLTSLRLLSAQLYNVKVIAKNTGTDESGDPNTSNIVKFTNSLHPIKIALPTSPFDRRTTKLWVSPQQNATEYIFQVSSTGDFSNLYTTSASTTQEGISGPVFKNNATWYNGTGWTPSETIQYHVFDYIPAITSDTLFIRCSGANSNQRGYFHYSDTIVINAPKIPFITNISNNQLVDSNIYFRLYDSPIFTETGYAFQVATESNFNSSSLVFNYTNWTNGDSIPNSKLKSNTQYFARVKASYSDAKPSPWSSTLTFTTKPKIGLRLVDNFSFFNEISNDELSVSPNPFDKSFKIYSSIGLVSIKIHNEMGILVDQYNLNGNENQLIVQKNLETGVYIITIESKESLSRMKIYKK